MTEMSLCFVPLVLVAGYLAIVGLVRRKPNHICAIVIGVASHATEVLLALTLLGFPRGMSIRPMGLTGLMFVVAMAALIAGAWPAIRTLRNKETRAYGVLGFVAIVTPTASALAAMKGIAFLWDLTLAN